MFTKNSFNGKADPVADAIKAIAEADYALKMEALKGDQTKLDKNKNNKLDADDFKIIRGEKKKTVKEEDEKPRSAGSVFDKDVAKSFTKKKGEGTGHEAKETKTGTQYTKKAPKDSEETNEDFSSFKDKLKSGVKKVLDKAGGGSDEKQLKRLQKNMGAKPEQQTGKKSMAKYNEEFDLESLDPALVEEFMQTEEFEQLDELSKKTLKKYVKKATDSIAGSAITANDNKLSHHQKVSAIGKWSRRESGVHKAVDRLAKEEVEQIEERKLTKAEKKKKKKLVKGMKKGMAGFKARYGSRGKDVMYATATKKAEE
jgi:hypothetical protein